ncbi:MAG: CPBP family intramembrane metalloprotease [Leptospiraceae bacterium]|nr:CPBP family intramembrane metalloprotease [Leptospiraceae bacterium]
MDHTETNVPSFISIKEASWISVFLVLLMFLFSLFSVYFGNETIKNFFELLAYVVSSLIIIYYVLKKHSYIKLTFKKIDLKDILLLIPLSFSLVILSEFLLGLIPINPNIAAIFTDIFSYSPTMFLLTVVCAPILEEVICRGVIQQGLMKKYSIYKSIFWSAFLFGSIHLNPWQFIAGFFIGLVCGWIYYLYDNLTPTILIHFIVNLISMLAQIFIPELSQFGSNTTKLLLNNQDMPYYFVIFISTLVFSICLYSVQKKGSYSETLSISK